MMGGYRSFHNKSLSHSRVNIEVFTALPPVTYPWLLHCSLLSPVETSNTLSSCHCSSSLLPLSSPAKSP
ncbi:hypothetical protein E2C01_067947 [Portunus trituberculatus]|uniref:Uncharacterized protein n=1 Tax=Portunus trituberculatus TaxID=210409 RepID=A0A5B7HQP4_PORTR|nr:hypothetical protein [Portunus trituberculatus]